MRILGKVLVVAGLLIVGVGLGVGVDRGTPKPKPAESGKKPLKK